MNANVQELRGEILLIRKTIVDRTEEAEALHSKKLLELQKVYKESLDDIKSQVTEKMKGVVLRNEEILDQLEAQMAAIDVELAKLR